MTTYDRSFSTAGTSSVIDSVYYNSETQELYVQLLREDWRGSPIIAGYEGVQPSVYENFEFENKHGSVGAYWNRFVKPYFKGLDSAGVELEPTVDAEAVNFNGVSATNVDVVDNTTSEVVITDDSAATFDAIMNVDEDENINTNIYSVQYEEDEDEYKNIRLYAANGDDALARFNKIAKITGWGYVRVISITRHFD